MKKRTAFISYAREDAELVRPIVSLLRAAGVTVFMDTEDIAYGEKWEVVLLENLRASERILVFWSANASRSDWVRREYHSAISEGLRVVPVPLDGTPLSAELSVFQASTALVPLLYAAQNPRAMPLPRISSTRIVGLSVALAVTLSLFFFEFPSRIVSSANFVSGPSQNESEALALLFVLAIIIAVMFLILISSLIWNLSWYRALREISIPKPQGEMRKPPGAIPELQRSIYEAVFYT